MATRSGPITTGVITEAASGWRRRHSCARAACLASVALCVSLCLLSLHSAGAAASPSTGAPVAPASAAESGGPAQVIPGLPIILAPGAGGSVWYGGEAGYAEEDDSQVDYISPTGAFRAFEFGPEVRGWWPEYFAPGPNDEEWCLVETGDGHPYEPHSDPLLLKFSPLGMTSVLRLPVSPDTEVRGLAMGADGNLWTTETRLEGHTRISAILRITPAGVITGFSKGLQRGALPLNITADPDGALWFTDATGRIGRIDTSGAIREFPIKHRLYPGELVDSPWPIIADRSGDLWFIDGPQEIGRMTLSGRVHTFILPSPYQEPEPDSIVELVGLAPGPEGDVWFTRNIGEVGRIDSHGHITRVTNRLIGAEGIAFANGGVAWVGEVARSRTEPTTVARISASGQVTQYPTPPPCRVPDVLGHEPSSAAELVRSASCELAGITRPRGSRSNLPIVVAQSVRPGTLVPYKTPIRLKLGPEPPAPKTCREPQYAKVLANSRSLIAWTGPEEIAYVACLRPRGTKRTFFTAESTLLSYDVLDTLHAAGTFLAFTSSSAEHYNNGDRDLTVYDVRKGSEVFGVGYSFAEMRPGPSFGSFAVNAHGAVAWVKQVTEGESQSHQDTLEVHDATGTHAVETRASIAGLAFRGRLLVWESAGQVHSLALR